MSIQDEIARLHTRYDKVGGGGRQGRDHCRSVATGVTTVIVGVILIAAFVFGLRIG